MATHEADAFAHRVAALAWAAPLADAFEAGHVSSDAMTIGQREAVHLLVLARELASGREKEQDR